MQALPPLGPLHGGFVLSGLVEGRERGPNRWRKIGFYFKQNKTNKQNYPVGEKQTGRLAGLDKAELDKAGQDTDDI